MPDSRRIKAELARVALDLARDRRDAALAALVPVIARERARVAQGDAAYDDGLLLGLSFAALMAQRAGDPALARSALDAAARANDPGRYLVEYRLWSTVDCLLHALPARRPCLDRLIDGREPYQTRVARWELLRDEYDADEAREEATWLASHRGMAVGELEGNPLQIENLLAASAAEATLAADPARPD